MIVKTKRKKYHYMLKRNFESEISFKDLLMKIYLMAKIAYRISKIKKYCYRKGFKF